MLNHPERPGALLLAALRGAWVSTATAALAAAVDTAITSEPATALRRPVVLLAIVLVTQLVAGVLQQIAGVSATAGGLPAMLIRLVTSVLITVVALISLALVDWWLVVTLLLATPVFSLLLRVFTRKVFDVSSDYQAAQAGIAARMVDALAGRRTIRAAGTLAREVDRVLAILPALRAAGARFWAVQRKVTWSFTLLVPVVQVVVLSVAGWGVARGQLSAAELVAVLGYLTLVLVGRAGPAGAGHRPGPRQGTRRRLPRRSTVAGHAVAGRAARGAARRRRREPGVDPAPGQPRRAGA
ncbi:MAG: ABC transporter transmembrane domain-containing protein [Pseudonocardiaceae bacterium]